MTTCATFWCQFHPTWLVYCKNFELFGGDLLPPYLFNLSSCFIPCIITLNLEELVLIGRWKKNYLLLDLVLALLFIVFSILKIDIKEVHLKEYVNLCVAKCHFACICSGLACLKLGPVMWCMPNIYLSFCSFLIFGVLIIQMYVLSCFDFILSWFIQIPYL